MASKANFIANIEGEASGSKVVRATWELPDPILGVTVAALASGDNLIVWPTGATVCLVVPPVTETETIVLKGLTGDQGFPVSSTFPFVVTKSIAVSIRINSTGTTTQVWTFNFM